MFVLSKDKLQDMYRLELTQEERVKKVLEAAEGDWVSARFFIQDMLLTQVHRAIWNLEHRMGVEIEHSDFRDDFGFMAYRIKNKETLF